MEVVQASPPAARRSPIVFAVAAASGLLACLAGLHPTASRTVDIALVFCSAAAVTIAASTARWWAAALACGIAAAVAPGAVLLIAALAGVFIAAVVGSAAKDLPWTRSLAALIAVQVLARLRIDSFVGLSALIGCTTLLALFVLGIRGEQVRVRQRVWFLSAVAGSMIVVGLIGLIIAGWTARDSLTFASRQARAGLADLQRGNIPAATDEFTAAAAAFAEADGSLSSKWSQVSRFIPVAAHYQAAGAGVASGAADVMRRAATALAQVDEGSVAVVDGAIDIDAIRALQQPFADLDTAITDFGNVLDGVSTQWLAAPLTRRFDELRVKIDSQLQQLGTARTALEVAPALLGEDGPRHYFVAFTTPAEARGLGGFMGNYAEVTIDHGRIDVGTFGRRDELDRGGSAPGERRITGPADFISHWGGYGFVDPADGTTGLVPWMNVTMPPDLPTVAQVIAELYPQSGGRRLDGVFVIDPAVIATMMNYTGSITVDGTPEPISADNVERFIIVDQYAIASGDNRVDLLDTIAHTTLDRLMSSALPDPVELGRAFSPLARAGHLAAWSPDPAAEALFRRIGMSGAFPALDGSDGIAAVIDNAGANKLDAYLQVDVDYSAVNNPATGATQSTATITLTNSVEPDGLPKYVLSNIYGLVVGTNRTLLSVYSALPLQSATIDGTSVQMASGTALGWQVATLFVDVPPGGERTLELTFDGTIDPGPYRVVTRAQPMVLPQRYSTRLVTDLDRG